MDFPTKLYSYLVFDNKTEVATAVNNAYTLGEQDNAKEVAEEFRKSVQNQFQNYQNLHWPPSFDYLNNTDILPKNLTSFLNILLAGKASGLSTQKNRIVSSIGQDICRSITNSQWKLPKHILLCMTLRHLFRSKELLTLVNRFGHCESHSFSLELETAIARAVKSSSSLV